MEIRKRCIDCKEEHVIKCSKKGYEMWTKGAFIQVAFPKMSADDRELLMSGICGRCYDKMCWMMLRRDMFDIVQTMVELGAKMEPPKEVTKEDAVEAWRQFAESEGLDFKKCPLDLDELYERCMRIIKEGKE